MRIVKFSGLQPVKTGLLSYPQRAEARILARLWRDMRGATAVEFGLIGGLFVILLLNGVDLGYYLYLRTQVASAIQAGAHSVWEKCDPMKLPIVPKCYPDLEDAKTKIAGVMSSMVKGITRDHITIGQGYYCPDVSGQLHSVEDLKNLPEQCIPKVTPGDYVNVEVTYSFAPLVGGLTISGLFGTNISMNSYMRLQ